MKRFREVVRDWDEFSDMYDNDMAAAGIEPPISPEEYLMQAIDEAVKDREEEIREKIEMIKFETAPEKRINFDDILSQLERKEE